MTGSQIKPPEFSLGLSSLHGAMYGIAVITCVTFIFLIPTASIHPNIQFVMHTIIVYQDVSLSDSNHWLLKC
jgi:ABC-type glucose/galactose transport system permease subunit